jgi:hypothetical protein
VNATSGASAPAPMVFRLPWSLRALGLIAVMAIGGAAAFLTAVAILAAFKREWGLAALVAVVACFVAGLTGYVCRDLRGKWRLRLALEPHALALDLPAERSLIHRPPALHQTVPYADIAAVETRLVAYRTVGMGMMQRAYVLRCRDGKLIFLFEDRAVGTRFESALFARLAADIAARAGVPVRDLGMAEGDGGFLGVWGTHAPEWSAPEISAERQAKLRRIVVITGLLPIPIILIAIIVRLWAG